MQDKIKIEKVEEQISNFLSVLNDLYLPLIGKDSFNLYIFYLSNDSKNIKINDLLNENSIKSEDFYLFNKKLNALNLIKMYESDDELLIKVFSPLSGFNFFKSIALKTVFISKVSEEYQKEMFNKYLYKINKKYKEIIFTLNDCFSYDVINNENLVNSLKVDNGIKINGKFSIAKCFSFLKKTFPDLKIENFSSEDIVKVIEYSNLYGIKENKIAEFLTKSIEKEDSNIYKINFKKFNKEVEMFLKYENKLLKDKTKKEEIKFKNNSNSDNSKLIEYYLSTPPLELIKDRTRGLEASKDELKTVNLLFETYGLDRGIINAINDYLLTTYGFINPSYAEQFARVFKRKDINGLFEVLEYLYKKNKNSSKINNNYSNIKETKEDLKESKKENNKIEYLYSEDDSSTDFD